MQELLTRAEFLSPEGAQFVRSVISRHNYHKRYLSAVYDDDDHVTVRP